MFLLLYYANSVTMEHKLHYANRVGVQNKLVYLIILCTRKLF